MTKMKLVIGSFFGKKEINGWEGMDDYISRHKNNSLLTCYVVDISLYKKLSILSKPYTMSRWAPWMTWCFCHSKRIKWSKTILINGPIIWRSNLDDIWRIIIINYNYNLRQKESIPQSWRVAKWKMPGCIERQQRQVSLTVLHHILLQALHLLALLYHLCSKLV